MILDKLYRNNIQTKGAITDAKKYIEYNDTMHKSMLGENWIIYSYKNLYLIMDNPLQCEKVVSKKFHHDLIFSFA